MVLVFTCQPTVIGPRGEPFFLLSTNRSIAHGVSGVHFVALAMVLLLVGVWVDEDPVQGGELAERSSTRRDQVVGTCRGDRGGAEMPRPCRTSPTGSFHRVSPSAPRRPAWRSRGA